MSGEIVLHIHSNPKSFIESKEIKNFLDFLKEDKYETNEFFKPKTFRLYFELVDSTFGGPFEKFFDPKLIKHSIEVSIFKFVKIISSLYNTKDISCSKDGNHLYYKNVEIDNFEFTSSNEFAFVIKREVGDFEEFINKNDSLNFRTKDGTILVESPDKEEEYVYLDKSLHLVNEYELSSKYCDIIKSIGRGRKLQMLTSKYSDSKKVLPKTITESLNILDDYEGVDEENPKSEICDLEVIISNDSLSGAYSRDIYLSDYVEFLNRKTGDEKFSVSIDGKHIYYEDKEVIDRISTTFRTLIKKFELSSEDAEDFRKTKSLSRVASKVLRYAIRNSIPGFSMNSDGILSYNGNDKLSIGINDDDELEVFEEHDLDINTDVLSFYLNRIE